MSTVYCTQIPSRLENGQWAPTVDINPAKEHGNVLIMFPAGMNYPSISPEMESQLKDMADDFNPDTDHFMPLGDPLLMVAAAAALGSRGNFRMLKWDRHQRRYYSYEVKVPE